MEPVRIDFLKDNLSFGGLEPETCQQVLATATRGSLVRTTEGWPVVSLDRLGDRFLLDGPLHYNVLERLGREADCVVIVFGLGAGNTVRALKAAGISVAAVFEPDPGVLRNFLEYGPNDLGSMPIVSHERELETIWPRVVGNRDNVHVTDTPGYARAFAPERASLTTKIADLLERNLVNEQTIRARGRVWVEDIIENAEHIARAPSAHHLQGAFPKVPAFIVGAGPSLNKNIELVRTASTKGIVFSVNSSGRALDQAGIKPHILAALESIDVSHLISNLSFIDEVVRLFSLTAHPNLFHTGTGPLLTLYELLPHIAGPFEAFFGRPGLPVCGSVSTACFSLAYRMGCDPIVLVGQDLAYTDGRCYADGTPYEQSRVSVNGQTLRHDWCPTMVDTHHRGGNELLPGQKSTQTTAWGGKGTVHSAATFNHVRMWLERVAALLQQSGGPTLINSTEGGARIANFTEQSLAEVLECLPDVYISPSDIEEKARRGGPQMQLGDVINLLRANQRGAESVATAARVLAAASHAADAAWDHSDPSVVSRRLRELQYAEAELKNVVGRFPWVDAWAWGDVDDALESTQDITGIPEALKGVRVEGALGEAIMNSARMLAARLESRHLGLKERHEKNS